LVAGQRGNSGRGCTEVTTAPRFRFPMKRFLSFSTETKVALARIVSTTLVRLGVRTQRQIRRHGLTFDVDIREGIDLSLFLFGSFERDVLTTIKTLVPTDGIVIDVGANIGALTLPVADYVTRGHVYAVEPTDFAFAKLRTNLALNPGISPRVTAIQSFVASETAPVSKLVAYSSWPVTGGDVARQHPVHKGVPQAAGCGQVTLDGLIEAHGIKTVSLIKIDTDGHEFSVLSGATQCLKQLRPAVIFEACEYLLVPPRPTFDDFAKLFTSHDYTICERTAFQPIDREEFFRTCPSGGGLDLLALPNERVTRKSFDGSARSPSSPELQASGRQHYHPQQ
jgi:FkbM family methyltransferase